MRMPGQWSSLSEKENSNTKSFERAGKREKILVKHITAKRRKEKVDAKRQPGDGGSVWHATSRGREASGKKQEKRKSARKEVK